MDKWVVVTGAGRGIGLAIARELKNAGYKVAGFSRSTDPAEGVFDYYDKLDVSDFEAVKNFASKIEGEVWAIVNNAGITKDALFARMTEEDFDKVIAVNLKGVFNVCKAFEAKLRKSKGVIVNITSISGLYGNVGQANYAASKSALIGFTYTLAKEYGRYGVRAVAVAPGLIETDMSAKIPEKIKEQMKSMIPLKRFGKVEEVAKLVRFLISEDASYITGTCIEVAGGFRF